MANYTPRIDTGMVDTSMATRTAGNWERRGGVSHMILVTRVRDTMSVHTDHMSKPSRGLDDDFRP